MFQHLYKSKTSAEERQEQRRRALLEQQKQRRLQAQDEHRVQWGVDGKLPKLKLQGKNQNDARTFQKAYRMDLTLQLSEWLREPPAELNEWLLVPCPRGRRCMVVANRGRTEIYTKTGRFWFRFQSLLPGGGVAPKKITILDCIHNKKTNTFYVLDVLAYCDHDFVNCEADFRFYWIRSRFEENTQLSEHGANNQPCFRLLEQYDLDDMQKVASVLQRYPNWSSNKPELDGFLFYHKKASYTCGTTPLVGWLFAFMVPNVLGLSVSPDYEQPADYVDALQYMTEFDAKEKDAKKTGRRSVEKDNGDMVGIEEADSVNFEEDELQCMSDAEAEFAKDTETSSQSLVDLMDAEQILEKEGVRE